MYNLPRPFSKHKGNHPQGGQHLILAKVYIWFNGANPYCQYCGGIRKLQWKTYLFNP